VVLWPEYNTKCKHAKLDSNKPGIAEIATLPTVRRRAVSVQGGVEWGATAAVFV